MSVVRAQSDPSAPLLDYGRVIDAVIIHLSVRFGARHSRHRLFAGQRNFSPPLKIKSSLFNIGQLYLLNQIILATPGNYPGYLIVYRPYLRLKRFKLSARSALALSWEVTLMVENRPTDSRDAELQPCPDPFHQLDASIPEETFSRADMERRRMEAAGDMLNGLSQSGVARKFGVSRTTASRWHLALTTSGLDSLRERKTAGRPSRLTREQKAQIVKVYLREALQLPASSPIRGPPHYSQA